MGYNWQKLLWVNSIDVLLVATLEMDPLHGCIDATTVVTYFVIVAVVVMVTIAICVKAPTKPR